ncbi:SRPBCC family protein [Streptomyces sp. NPDC005151]
MTSTSRSGTPTDVSTAPATPHPAPVRRRHRLLTALAALAALAALLTGYTTWANIHPVKLTASIQIEATPDEVWQALTDFSTYPQWNPFMTSAQVTSPGSRLEEGARMRIVMHDDTGDTTFTPRILTATPGTELRWLGKLGPGWIADGEHRFTIETLGPDRVRLTQSERFTGIAVPFVEGRLKSDTLPQFRAMNEALAKRAEALSR